MPAKKSTAAKPIREGNPTPLMKDRLGPEAVDRMAQALEGAFAAASAPRGRKRPAAFAFDPKAFRRQAERGLADLELKQRVDHLIAVLHRHLPEHYPDAALILQQLPAAWHLDTALAQDGDPTVGSFAAWPLIDYTAVHGLEHPSEALDVLGTLTPMFSAEFAIRPFLARYPEQTFQKMQAWSLAEDPHVRRLASEGCRPRLPWGKAVAHLSDADSPAWDLLQALREDPSPYVRRSVANHWNDRSKSHPDQLLDRLEAWKKQSGKSWTDAQQRTLRHSLRSLIKEGHPRALALVGIRTDRLPEHGPLLLTPESEAPASTKRNKTPTVRFGHTLQMECAFQNHHTEAIDVLVDCVLHFRKSNGHLAPKVFKGKRFRLEPGQSETWRMRRGFKPITTRRYYPGLHRVELRINGQQGPSADFVLHMPEDHNT